MAEQQEDYRIHILHFSHLSDGPHNDSGAESPPALQFAFKPSHLNGII